jgi:cytochrome P450
MLQEMAKLTAGIIGRTVFGDDTTEDEASRVVRNFTVYQRYIDQTNIGDVFGIPVLSQLSNPLRRRRSLAAAAEVQSVIDQIIDRHRRCAPAEQFSLLSHFLGGADGISGASGCPMSAAAVRNEAIVMFMAGHETTANSLAWCWYLLDHSPRVAALLRTELDEVLRGRDPNFEDVPRLPYTRAVFEEALRLYPPVPLLTRQARQADCIQGHQIPGDSVIMVVPWLLHRHRKYWKRPDHFVPERFMPGRPRPNRYVYMPFSAGARVCLGLRFGLIEGILCLATLAQRFEARLQPGHQVGLECRLTLRPRGGLPMLLEPR